MRDRQTPDLAQLIDACAQQDRDAFRNLFDAEAGRLISVAYRILCRRDLAEEAVQEAFIQIWDNAHRYNAGLGSPRAWMNTIVRFRAIDMLRAQKPEDPLPSDTMNSLRDSSAEASWNGLDSDGRLHLCLGEIDDWSRHALLLSYVAGLTQAEIAGRFGKPLGSVKSWMRRGLISLRECLK
ncbi:MAG: RNA polymerase subunit sigma [Rhodobacteraceae bacterium]|nr:RNA polymerase subunit sigma [Paracoccaceae bacterium]